MTGEDLQATITVVADMVYDTYISGEGLENTLAELNKKSPLIGMILPMLKSWVTKLDKKTLIVILYKVLYKTEVLDRINAEREKNEYNSRTNDAQPVSRTDGERQNLCDNKDNTGA